jgi:hypothetical protein
MLETKLTVSTEDDFLSERLVKEIEKEKQNLKYIFD